MRGTELSEEAHLRFVDQLNKTLSEAKTSYFVPKLVGGLGLTLSLGCFILFAVGGFIAVNQQRSDLFAFAPWIGSACGMILMVVGGIWFVSSYAKHHNELKNLFTKLQLTTVSNFNSQYNTIRVELYIESYATTNAKGRNVVNKEYIMKIKYNRNNV